MDWAYWESITQMPELIARAEEAGHDLVVGVGGDGTHHYVVNALVNSEATERLTYAPFPLGSGNDWIRSHRLPRRFGPWVEAVRRGGTTTQRIGRITYVEKGEAAVRYFINVAGLAYDAEVTRRSAALPVRNRWLYPLITLAALGRFSPPELQLTIDGSGYTGRFHTINAGIGKYSGGGMRLVPHADLERDTLALTFARAMPVWKVLLHGWRFYTGSIGRVRGVTLAQIREIVVIGPTEVEADGEWLGRSPVRITLLPERLRVLAP